MERFYNTWNIEMLDLGLQSRLVLLYIFKSMLQHNTWIFIISDPINGELDCKFWILSDILCTEAFDNADFILIFDAAWIVRRKTRRSQTETINW